MANSLRGPIPAVLLLAAADLSISVHGPKQSGALRTTTADGTAVNWNIYATSTDVYVSGGPQNARASGLNDGTYCFQVTDPSGNTLLSTDNAVCRQLSVVNGRVAGSTGAACKHANGTPNTANGTTPVQLAPFSASPNKGGVHKAWPILEAAAAISASDPKVLVLANANAKTDNFKVAESVQPPIGSCQPSSSLSVINPPGTADVVFYVPRGAWSGGPTGIAVVNVEGSAVLPTVNLSSEAPTCPSCRTVLICAVRTGEGRQRSGEPVAEARSPPILPAGSSG